MSTIRCSILAVLLLLALFISCKKDEVINNGVASARLVNTIAAANPQYLYQNETKISTSAVGYGNFGDYMELLGGQSVLWTNDASENKATALADVILYDKYKYTLFYYENLESKATIAGFVNQDKAPAAGKIRLRFLNISSSFNNKPLVLRNQLNVAIMAELKFGDTPVYQELSADTEIKVNVKDEAIVTTIPSTLFQTGKTYFVWFDSSDGVRVQYHIVPQN